LAGRAFEYRLFPFSAGELGKKFDLDSALSFGLLPMACEIQAPEDKIKYLKSYVSTYVKMEVQLEQLLRNIEPFREFLEIAAQMNGRLINYSRIAREVGVDTKTVQTYYSILEDTYLGFKLPAFHQSIRKSQLLTPKFYFFDIGLKRALEGALHSPPVPGTSYFGETFEHFVVLEVLKRNAYSEMDYRLSYFGTKDKSEIDLILSRGKEKIFVEIKSTRKIDDSEVQKLGNYVKEERGEGYYLSLDSRPRTIHGIRCLPWDEGLKRIFLLTAA
jgi:predicted AAA+ superfamily ATPase